MTLYQSGLGHHEPVILICAFSERLFIGSKIFSVVAAQILGVGFIGPETRGLIWLPVAVAVVLKKFVGHQQMVCNIVQKSPVSAVQVVYLFLQGEKCGRDVVIHACYPPILVFNILANSFVFIALAYNDIPRGV